MFDRRGHNRPPFRPRIPGTDLRAADVPVAIIYRPARDPMQSGPRPRHWILEFEPAAPASVEPLMGWTATRDPYRPIRLSFPDCQSAIDYAERNDWDYIVRDRTETATRRRPEPIFARDIRLENAPVPAPAARKDDTIPDEVDPVILASLESFPASDPPAWIGATLGGRDTPPAGE
ncbi:ETC complex I subunit [Roseovarius sp. SCSIO 43702]|uniref:NADH dehydrogenase ubiquinone Fe-S protein 4 n=1 Tax=Roseovarius sp. SCSIO 43702 TaxID=2823043 RepID=UPI001C72E59F|nr:NADH dehydrogenase ubiquinone Fe-S protein 4 [Roseovarius sp. SCSIO 43702]QYX55696.1 ETC complex I subunit [Roseovarius sp. SCSIO 43702]